MRPRLRRVDVGWLFVVLTVWLPFTAPWGKVAADTKHDLVADPGGFLAGALNAWSDNFTLGQLQNQAYGYLFPHGLFFWTCQWLPDWVTQRLWWTLVLTVGYFGFTHLARRVLPGAPAVWVAVGGVAYALSPRVLSTLTAISSETWPVMLAPWVVVPFVGGGRVTWRHVAAAVLPVALMGAVNATATLAACVPAAVVLVGRRRWRALLLWLAGGLAVSLWWIGPLVILGRFAPPFTEFIESAFVTTRWLNLAEILRGATSWTPFVETERASGTAFVTEPVFVLLTMAVAAAGLAGLAVPSRGVRVPRVWHAMLILGIVVMGMRFGWYLDVLDGPLAPLRNLHKFDPLVRLPLVLGVVALGSRLGLPRGGEWLRPRPRQAAGFITVLVVGLSTAPAWNGQLLPRGAFDEVPSYWHEAADFINAEAADTRTLIYPPASFARQKWGWTRDEPAQALVDAPIATRDSIPLVPPEAIRGLDGVMAVMEDDPAAGAAALQRLGIGAVLLRHDLDDGIAAADPIDADDLPGSVHRFGPNDEVEVIMLEPDRTLSIGPNDPVRVAGGGESLALLDALDKPRPRRLVDAGADIVTDTPQLVDRNYGTLHGPVSAPLAPGEPSTSHNRLRDYPSAGPYTAVEERGGEVRASSSAADADAFGGADPARSRTAAVDGDPDTAWWPAPGDSDPWLELRGDFAAPTLTLRATDDATVTIRSRDAAVDVEIAGGEEKSVAVPGGDTGAVRVELAEPVGLAEVAVEGHPVERVVSVPDTSPGVKQFVFQRLFVNTGNIIREFTAPRQMGVVVDSDDAVELDGASVAAGSVVTLTPGRHEVRAAGTWVTLSQEGWSPNGALESLEPAAAVASADSERLIVTGRAFNPGLRGYLDGVPLPAREIDAATQAFVIPAGVSGTFTMSFAADGVFRAWLIGGLVLMLAVALSCVFVGRWPGVVLGADGSGGSAVWGVVAVLALGLVSLPAAVTGVLGLLARRWVSPGALAPVVLAPVLCGIAGAILARAPWPAGSYAGDSWLIAALCGAAIAVAVVPRGGSGSR